MGLRVQQRLIFVLTVDVDQAASHLAKKPQRTETAIQVDAVFPRAADDSLNHHLVLSAISSLSQFIPERLRRLRKQRLNARLFLPMPNDLRRDPSAGDKAEGVEHNGFSGAGLAGQHIEARAEVQRRFIDHRETLDPELAQHLIARLSLSPL